MSNEEHDEEDPYYVLWETGTMEAFECENDAQQEIMAMGSRGFRGTIYSDMSELILALGIRLEIPIRCVNLTNDHRPEVREFGGKYPVAWDLHHPERGLSALLLHNGERKQEFRLVLYDSQENTATVTDSDFEGLSELLKQRVTRTGMLQRVVKKQASEIESLKAEIKKLKGI